MLELDYVHADALLVAGSVNCYRLIVFINGY